MEPTDSTRYDNLTDTELRAILNNRAAAAHDVSVAPHIARDLFGVMHHFNSDFGIIVSLGGFTKGTIEFARNKPIFLLDTSDLIAMQEGQDILAKNFPADPTP